MASVRCWRRWRKGQGQVAGREQRCRVSLHPGDARHALRHAEPQRTCCLMCPRVARVEEMETRWKQAVRRRERW